MPIPLACLAIRMAIQIIQAIVGIDPDVEEENISMHDSNKSEDVVGTWRISRTLAQWFHGVINGDSYRNVPLSTITNFTWFLIFLGLFTM